MKNKGTLCNQTSYKVEFYTPPPLLEATRLTLGGIDLDPSSNLLANKNVKATNIFTEEEDGLTQKWEGKIWMNHPWGAKENACKKGCKKKICKKRKYHLKKDFPGNAAWINKLLHHYLNKDITAALCITYASTGEGWFKPLKKYPICFLDGRTSFYSPEGVELDQNMKGCAVTYLGNDVKAFVKNFSPFGTVMVPVFNENFE